MHWTQGMAVRFLAYVIVANVVRSIAGPGCEILARKRHCLEQNLAHRRLRPHGWIVILLIVSRHTTFYLVLSCAMHDAIFIILSALLIPFDATVSLCSHGCILSLALICHIHCDPLFHC